VNRNETGMSNPNPHNQFESGKSGNPNGRPVKEMTLTALAKEFLNNIPDGQKKTYKEIFIQKVTQMALKGDMAAIKLIWNYLDGLPLQNIKVDGGVPVNPIAERLKEIKNNDKTDTNNSDNS